MRRPLGAIRQAGLTLIELMVTVLLATILIGGLFYMMSGQQKTYTNQVNVLTAQENLWGAMEYLERQVRMAGFGFGSCAAQIRTVGTGDGGIDTLTGLQVHNNLNLWTGASDGTDSFAVRYASSGATGQQSLRITADLPINATVLWASGVGQVDPIKNGDLVVVCLPGFPGTLMHITAVPAEMPQDYDGDGVNDWKLAMGPASPYNPPNWNGFFGPGAKYPPGASLIKFGSGGDSIKFAIDTTHNPPYLMSWRLADRSDAQIVASGIEDMQIAWACDTEAAPGNGIYTEGRCVNAGGGSACLCSTGDCTEKVNDEWAGNVASDVPPVCGDNPIQRVRLTLIARTDGPVIGDKRGKRPEAEDHYAGTPAQDLATSGGLGTYSRATLTSTVVPRNIRISVK